MKLLLVAGARPNFMKIAPIMRAVRARPDSISCKLVHTGQHYDAAMSQTFFDELDIPAPDYNLEVGSGSHAVQTANIMIRFEQVCLKEKPDMVMVVGDVNSTAACALVAKKLHIAVAHVEAGLRSGDRAMPEEINRLVTDAISDLLFVTEKAAIQNLRAEGHPENHIHFVGHVMIDNLLYQKKRLGDVPTPHSERMKALANGPYAVLTMHRPSNVDNPQTLERFLRTLHELGQQAPIFFPCHPRTRSRITEFGLERFCTPLPESTPAKGLILCEPLGYMEFLNLWHKAFVAITDSGGLQEETTALKIPCITIRQNTERPITAEVGSNEVIGDDVDKLRELYVKALGGQWKESVAPELWDGLAGERIVGLLA
jgi:UDP-N-acetylglucosamine 2-epimerase (non-hydrolysing)